MTKFFVLILLLVPSVCWGQFVTPTTSGTSDSVGVDTTGAGIDLWLYPAYLFQGDNINFDIVGDSLHVHGSAGGDSLSHETVEDIAGGMATGNTETGITVTYQDGDGTIDYEVSLGTDIDTTEHVDAQWDQYVLNRSPGSTVDTSEIVDAEFNQYVLNRAGTDLGATIDTATEIEDAQFNQYILNRSPGPTVDTTEIVDAEFNQYVENRDDTTTSYRAAIADSISDHWAAFLGNANESEIHDSLDANWATFIAGDGDAAESEINDSLHASRPWIDIADDGWVGLGASAGRIIFKDETQDTLTMWDCYIRAQMIYATGLVTTAAVYAGNGLTVAGGSVVLTAASVNLPTGAVDATAELAHQIVTGDKVDSTAEDFVFNDAYHVTSAEADSAYLTHGGAAATYVTATLTEEEVEDFVGGMLGGTETNISVDYNDGDNDIDFVVTVQKDFVTTAPVTGGTDDIFPGADADITVALDFTASWDFGGAAGLEIPAVDNPTTDAEGEIAWDANDDALEVYMGDESESALIPAYQKLDAHIFAPDGVNDEICIFRVDALLYPFGIEIDQVSITLPGDAAYSMVFEEWAADPPAAENDISTVTTGAGDAYAEEAPDTDAALDADDYIYLHVPATDVDWIHVQVIFHVNDGN